MEQSEVTPMGYSLKRDLAPSNQLQESPSKRHRIFEENHNESKSLSFGQLEESEPPSYNFKRPEENNVNGERPPNTGGQKSSGYTRNLIFEGG